MVETIGEIIQRISPYYGKKGGPEEQYQLVYDSAGEGLEPIYFFIIDLMDSYGLAPEKLIDNFSSAPGSGYFAEFNQRAQIMQEQGSKTLATINTILRSVLNLLYDLKDFKLRLKQYDETHSKDKLIKEAAILGLKQIWMDKVDISKGNSAIKAMALTQAGFVTLIDAFLVSKDGNSVDKLDLNDRVKRILKPRVQEFNYWLGVSEKELRRRYELEKSYLKSQVNSLKLYSRWAKPYLKAAQKLEQKEIGRSADLVKTFNTILLELTLLGKSKLDVQSGALTEELPVQFKDRDFSASMIKRNYYSCVLVDFYFRGIPQKAGQHQGYSFGGKTEVTFKAYALNENELEKLKKEIEKADLGDVLELLEGTTTESLGAMQDELDSYLNEKDEQKEKPKEVNPFLALFGKYEKTEKKQDKSKPKKQDDKPIKKDSWTEAQLVRPLAAAKASESALSLFDTYKKAHGMASYT